MRAAAVAATATAALGIAAPASAAPHPAPYLNLAMNGRLMLVMGDNAFCTGVVDNLIDVDPARPGHVAVTLIPRGVRGIAPAWNPTSRCKATVSVIVIGGGRSEVKQVPLDMGELPGEPVRTEFQVGSGIGNVSMGATFLKPGTLELANQYGTALQGIVLIP